MRHKTTQAVYDHFNRIRGAHPVPLRADIQPSDLRSALPSVFMLEIDRAGNPVFRLAGTQVCAIVGRELRGEGFLSLWHQPHRHKMKLAVEAVLANQAPMTVNTRSAADEEDDGDLEMLLMPLASRPGIVDRLFGSLADLSQPPLARERQRILFAGALHFLAPEPSGIRAFGTDGAEDRPIVTAETSAFRSRILRLRVLEGGRKD